jgi:hypothetical protein
VALDSIILLAVLNFAGIFFKNSTLVLSKHSLALLGFKGAKKDPLRIVV